MYIHDFSLQTRKALLHDFKERFKLLMNHIYPTTKCCDTIYNGCIYEQVRNGFDVYYFCHRPALLNFCTNTSSQSIVLQHGRRQRAELVYDLIKVSMVSFLAWGICGSRRRYQSLPRHTAWNLIHEGREKIAGKKTFRKTKLFFHGKYNESAFQNMSSSNKVWKGVLSSYKIRMVYMKSFLERRCAQH